MKKKLEAELISIAHRILKLKNRDEIAQLQQETLKLYEKLSVLRFVEENFSDMKPTIGYASAEEKLEEIYGLEEQPPSPQRGNDDVPQKKERKAKEVSGTDDIKEDKPAEEPVKAEEANAETDEPKQDKENDKGEGVDVGEGEAVSEEEIEYTKEETDEEVTAGGETANEQPQPEAEQEEAEEQPQQEEPGEEEQPEPKVQQESPKAEEAQTKRESLFEGFEDYIEPEFVKKSDIAEPNNINIEFLPKDPEIIAKQEEKAEHMWEEPKQKEPKHEEVKEEPQQEEKQPEPILDWRDWEPSKSVYASKPAEEPKKEESKKSLNDTFAKIISLGLNDRIAFEKNLFGGSSEDLNRVVSQLNTLNTFTEAKDFIEDLVKPDYNYWKGKEEYEERFMALVEKRFE